MRLRFDELCKQLLTAAFDPADRVERNAELDAADAQKVDLRLEPRPEGAANRARAGLLGSLLGEGPCHVEHFSEAPSLGALLEAVRKLLTARHQGAAEMRLWLLCAGRPAGALDALGFRPRPGEMAGIYRLPPAWATGLAVLGELPRRPETLLLRLLGRGATFRAALREFLALPSSAWVRQVAGPVLARLRFVGLAAHWTDEEGSEAMGDPGSQMMSDEETAALLAAAEQLYQEAEQRTHEQGLTQGREQVLARQLSRRLGRPLGEAETAALQARLSTLGAERLSDVVLELEGDALAAWLADPHASLAPATHKVLAAGSSSRPAEGLLTSREGLRQAAASDHFAPRSLVALVREPRQRQ